MAYYEMMPAGLPAGLQSGMDSVLNKKFGTSTSYAPGTWPDTVNLMGPLPEKTIVSSPIADFSDGSDDVPTKAVEITMPASLTGYNSASVVNSGNLCDFDNYNVEANTNTTVPLGADLTLKKGTYTLAFNISDTVTATKNRPCYVVNGNYTYADSDYKTSGRYSWTFTLADDTTLSIRWWAHTVSANITISDFMLTHGSTAHAYEPYQTPTQYTASLGRTIYGGKVDIVNGTGKDKTIRYELDETDTWGAYGGTTHSFWHNVATGEDRPIDQTKLTQCICNELTYSTTAPASAPDFSFMVQGGQRIVVTADSTIDTVDKFKTWLSSHNLVFVCPASTPTDFTFTGQEVPTRLGYNAFWSDEGDTEVTYRADINLALGGN